MSEEIENTGVQQVGQIIDIGGQSFYLQSVRNDEGEHNYTGYPCVGPEDETTSAGHEPGQCYLVEGAASLENAAEDLEPLLP